MATGAKLTGKEEMQQKLRNVAKNYSPKVGGALLAEMGIELKEVNKRTPVDSGDLVKSERLEGPWERGKSISVLIVADAPYAGYVHEDLEAFHKVGQAKFIESVLMESRPFIGARVAKRLNIADWVN
jgi:hypothetical protein